MAGDVVGRERFRRGRGCWAGGQRHRESGLTEGGGFVSGVGWILKRGGLKGVWRRCVWVCAGQAS